MVVGISGHLESVPTVVLMISLRCPSLSFLILQIGNSVALCSTLIWQQRCPLLNPNRCDFHERVTLARETRALLAVQWRCLARRILAMRASLAYTLPLLVPSEAFVPLLAVKPTAVKGRVTWPCTKVQDNLYVQWDANHDSFKESGQVGLGGGIEWALDSRFCQKIMPQFREPISCEALEKVVNGALRLWEDRHPTIFFSRTARSEHAEVIIGAQSKTMVDFWRKNKKWAALDPDIRKAHEDDVLAGISVDDVELGSGNTIAFAQALPDKFQASEAARTGMEVAGTAGGQMKAGPAARKRFRIIFNTDHRYFLHTDPACYDDDPEILLTVHYWLLAALVVVAVLTLALVVWLVPIFRQHESNEALFEEASESEAAKQDQAARQSAASVQLQGQMQSRSMHDALLAGKLADEALDEGIEEENATWSVKAIERQRSALGHEEHKMARQQSFAAHQMSANIHDTKAREYRGRSTVYRYMSIACGIGGPFTIAAIIAMISSGVYVHERRCGTLLSSKGAVNFESVLAHEMGHVLGLGHPDVTGLVLKRRDGPLSPSQFVPLEGVGGCDELALKYRTKECDAFTCRTGYGADFRGSYKAESGAGCRLPRRARKEGCEGTAHCAWTPVLEGGQQRGAGTCEDVYDATLMASKHDAQAYEKLPTEDDLAGLFFLYPASRRTKRSKAWGVGALPIKTFTPAKLRHRAMTLYNLTFDGSATKEDIVTSISCEQASRSERQAELLSVKAHLSHLSHLPQLTAAARRLRLLLQKRMRRKASAERADSTELVEINEALLELAKSRQSAEAADANQDGVVPVGRVGDPDGDGVDNQDSDGDEIPDVVEAGLDALEEAVACENDPEACAAGEAVADEVVEAMTEELQEAIREADSAPHGVYDAKDEL